MCSDKSPAKKAAQISTIRTYHTRHIRQLELRIEIDLLLFEKLKNIISPGSRILAGLVIDDEVEQLSRTLLIEVDAVVCTDPYIPLPVFINLAHTVVSKRSRRIVLLIPYQS